jgi:hypothetical protein
VLHWEGFYTTGEWYRMQDINVIDVTIREAKETLLAKKHEHACETMQSTLPLSNVMNIKPNCLQSFVYKTYKSWHKQSILDFYASYPKETILAMEYRRNACNFSNHHLSLLHIPNIEMIQVECKAICKHLKKHKCKIKQKMEPDILHGNQEPNFILSSCGSKVMKK